jgi:hypothetical protein
LGKKLHKLCGWQKPPDDYPPRDFLPYARTKTKSKKREKRKGDADEWHEVMPQRS